MGFRDVEVERSRGKAHLPRKREAGRPCPARPSVRVATGLAAFWLCLMAGTCLLPVGRAAAQQAPSQPVVAAPVVRRTLEIERTFVGSVIPKRLSLVGSPVEGRVIELTVEEGDRVRRGDKLAQLRTEPLEIELASAKAELELIEAELQRLKVAGPKEVEQAKARVAAAEALEDYTKSRLKRTESLLAGSVISKDELDEVISAAVGATKTLEERTAGWELAVAALPIDIARAEAKVRVQNEKIRELEDDIAEHTILAPFDGYVTVEHTEVGQWIAKGGPVVEVAELVEVDIEIPVLETYVSQLRLPTADRPGTATRRIDLDALPGVEVQGHVIAIVPKADVSARSFPVRVRVPNQLGPNGMLLKPGMFARVTLVVFEVPDATLIRKDGLVPGEGSSTVWVVRPGADFKSTGLGKAVPVLVSTGQSDGGWVQVIPRSPGGDELLAPGTLVITEGNERVNPALPVRVTKTTKETEQ